MTYIPSASWTAAADRFPFDDTRPNQFQHTVKLVELSSQEIFYDKLTFIYLEMAKFNKAEAELATHFDKWLYLLRNLNQFHQERIFRKAFQIAEVSNLNKEEMNAYEADIKYRRDWKNAMDFAVKKAVEKAVEETRETTSRRKQLEIVQMHKNAGVATDIIAQSTGLTIDEINAL